jgi:hypothetical protein
MSLGPIELLAVKFSGNRFTSEIISVLDGLVDTRAIWVVVVLSVAKDDSGKISVLELDDLDPESLAALDPLVEDVLGLFVGEDARHLANRLDNGSSAGLMLFENVWVTRISEAVTNPNGQGLRREHMSRTSSRGAAKLQPVEAT